MSKSPTNWKGVLEIKNGKKPTREQRKLIERWGLDAHNWFVIKDTPDKMEIVHRHSDRTKRTIPKGD